MAEKSNESKRLKMNYNDDGSESQKVKKKGQSDRDEESCSSSPVDNDEEEEDCTLRNSDAKVKGGPKKTAFIAVHLGAGEHPEKRSLEYRKLCDEACNKAMTLLKTGKPAGDAVAEAIKVLEDSRVLNAGSGSNLTIDGTVECDAGYMDGEGYFGGVGAVPGVPNPILIAKSLADTHRKEKLFSCGRIPPTFLVGQSGKAYASSNGLATCDDKDMISAKAKQTYDKYINRLTSVQNAVNDTVGAIALDSNGKVASGVSSGGHWLKYSGRVGHSPLFGCGCFSSSLSSKCRGAVAVSVSGSGEMLSRVRLAEVCGLDVIKNYGSNTIQKTIFEHVLENKSLNVHSEPRYAGVIALHWDGKHGEFSWAHSTKNFVIGYLKGDVHSPTDDNMRPGKIHPSFLFSEMRKDREPGEYATSGGTSF